MSVKVRGRTGEEAEQTESNALGIVDRSSVMHPLSRSMSLIFFHSPVETGEFLGQHEWAEEMLREAEGDYELIHVSAICYLLASPV